MIYTITPNPALDRTLTVPAIVFDEMVRASESQLDLDGKGVNVSKALRALGDETVIMGFAGGAAGAMLTQGLHALGFAADFTAVAGETRTNTIIIDAASRRYVKANEAGPQISPAELAALGRRVAERARPGDLWIMAGSLPPGAPAELYARLIELVQAAGARALLDSSGAPLRAGCAARPFLVKPNADEAAELTGEAIDGDAAAVRAARVFLAQGIELVALSMGAEGMLLAARDALIRARPPQVRALNPVGAGDALMAGVAWALARGMAIEELARWGVASGTAAAMHAGTGAATRAEVAAIYEQVRAERIDA
ncbi:1-phosphofructokinase [Kouleothrix sp.]|uniref:1-phosphofructokinase n=1 Tax=Kouleothrix sp. TaxID=2779161 RepID=UPI0039194C3E